MFLLSIDAGPFVVIHDDDAAANNAIKQMFQCGELAFSIVQVDVQISELFWDTLFKRVGYKPRDQTDLLIVGEALFDFFEKAFLLPGKRVSLNGVVIEGVVSPEGFREIDAAQVIHDRLDPCAGIHAALGKIPFQLDTMKSRASQDVTAPGNSLIRIVLNIASPSQAKCIVVEQGVVAPPCEEVVTEIVPWRDQALCFFHQCHKACRIRNPPRLRRGKVDDLVKREFFQSWQIHG